MGPNAAKTERRGATPAARTAPSTEASAPTQQPTARERREERTEQTTRETRGAKDAGKEREPQKPTRAKETTSKETTTLPAAGARNETPADETGGQSAGLGGHAMGKLCLGEKFCGANPVGAPALLASFRRPLRGRRPALQLPARRGFQSGGGWHLASWGESGRGGFGDNLTGFSVRFQTPFSHVPPLDDLRLRRS